MTGSSHLSKINKRFLLDLYKDFDSSFASLSVTDYAITRHAFDDLRYLTSGIFFNESNTETRQSSIRFNKNLSYLL